MLWSKINSVLQFIYWASITYLKVADGNTRWMCEICWKLTVKTPHYCHWHCSCVLTVKHISHLALLFLMFLLLTLNRFYNLFYNRDYNSFDVKPFKEDLDMNLKSNNTVHFSDFQNTFITFLHTHASIKKKSSDSIIVLSCPKP